MLIRCGLLFNTLCYISSNEFLIRTPAVIAGILPKYMKLVFIAFQSPFM